MAASSDSVAYINGKVYTINPAAPWAEAFIVSPSGIFTAIGSTAEIKTQTLKSRMPVYDLRQRFVMPGIHDAHVHLLVPALSFTSHVNLPDSVPNTTAAAEQIKRDGCLCKYSHVHADWLLASTYMVENFSRQEMDAVFPDTPIAIRGGAAHSAFANTAALERAGYDLTSEPDCQGGWYARDAEGRLTGEMAETATTKLWGAVPKAGATHVRRVLKIAQRQLHRAGVTSCQEAATNTALLAGMRGLDESGELKLEIAAHVVYAPEWIAEEPLDQLHQVLEKAEESRSKHVDTRFVKIILDGVPLEPYLSHAGFDESGNVDEKKLFLLNLQEAVIKYDALGYTIKTHCTGQGATRLALDAYAAARKTNPGGPRHEVAHCSGVADEEYQRFQDLQVTAEMSPAFLFVNPLTEASNGLMDWNFGKMLAAGAHMTIGSDWGAGDKPDVLPCLAGVVDAVGQGNRSLGGEKLCRMLTLAGAEAVGRQKDLGSIEVGKKANFISLDKDLSKGEFEGASVLTTWFEGEIVYEKE